MTSCQQAAEKAVKILKEKNLKVTFAESCTGGLLSKLITDVSGASQVFDGGVVSYSNSVKAGVLGVEKELLDKYGAVSCPVAVEMAVGVRTLMNSDIAVSVTGIAGPESDETGKPVGLIYVAICDKETVKVKKLTNCFKGENVREKNREASALAALELVEQYADLYPEKSEDMVAPDEVLKKYL